MDPSHLPLLGRSHVDEAGRVVSAQSRRYLLRTHLNAPVDLLGVLNEADDLVEVDDVVTVRHLLEDVIRLIPTAVTSADMETTKQGALRAGIGLKDLPHRAALRDLRVCHRALLIWLARVLAEQSESLESIFLF